MNAPGDQRVTDPQRQAPAGQSALGRATPFYVVAGFFTLAVNLLMLVTPLYMLQVYDRVLTSGSLETLLLLSVMAAGLLAVYGFAEGARRRTTSLLADFLQAKYASVLVRSSLETSTGRTPINARLTDLTTIQSFHQNGLSLPLFDLPFTPLFLIALFLVHPVLGWLGVGGAIVLIAIAVATEFASRKGVAKAQAAERSAHDYIEALERNRSAVLSHGMAGPVVRRFGQRKAIASQLAHAGGWASHFFGSQARGLRHMLQIAALGLGAWLVLQEQLSAGAIIAGSILLGRGLAPIDQTLGAWRQVVKARAAWRGLRSVDLDGEIGSEGDVLALPRPEARLQIEGLAIGPPGADDPILPKFNLDLKGGSLLVVLGQSGAGKTTLLQTIGGVWSPLDGAVRLGGRELHRWDPEDRGKFIGYTPQSSELLPGTIAENISRFDDAADGALVIEAAQAAGVHEMIVRLTDGYDTVIDARGGALSRGQKQAVSLARAFYQRPALMIMDEPTANLDQRAVEQVRRALADAKTDDTLIIIATHDDRLIDVADHVLILGQGTLQLVPAKDYLATLKAAKKTVPSREGRAS